MARIAIIQGHPDPEGGHLDHALAQAYAEGARSAGHQVEIVEPAKLDFGFVRNARDFYEGAPAPDIAAAQDVLRRADHLVFVYPLWEGSMPARLHAFVEQTFRPGFAIGQGKAGFPKKLLAGKSARIVVTMGMPSLMFRLVYGAHSLKAFTGIVLGFSGVRPVRTTLLGLAGAGSDEAERQKDFHIKAGEQRIARWLALMRRLGREAR